VHVGEAFLFDFIRLEKRKGVTSKRRRGGEDTHTHTQTRKRVEGKRMKKVRE
jgi:hypothetical protein